MGFINWLTDVNGEINTFVWVTLGLALLIGTGVLMTCLTKFFQVAHIGHWFKQTLGSLFTKKVAGHTKDNASISQFQALCTALAATVGVGNIAGVAAAIVTGGPGAVFWMWVAAFFGMMTNYSENVLGIYYRRKVGGEWAGGAMYYLRDGMGKRKGFGTISKVLAMLFACFAVLASFGIGNMGQVNKIVANLESAFDIPALSGQVLYEGVSLYSILIGVVLMILVAVIVIGGLKRIANVAEKIVPVMIALFLLGSLIIIGVNYANVGGAFSAIFRTAFTAEAAWGAAGGIAIKEIITCGFKRGVFSNEAGLGSSVMVHSNSNVKEPVRQGMWGIFEVFVDTMVVCTMTALVVLTSGVIDLNTGAILKGTDDSTLVAKAFEGTFGTAGEMFIALAVLLFAFTTVLGWSQYGAKAVEYLGGKHGHTAKKVYKVIFVLLIMSGVLLTNTLAWDISDTFNGLMMIPNLIGVLFLCGTVRKITKNYVDRKIKHKDVEPMLSYDPRIQAKMKAELDADN
ncbi:MAG: alanine:cation symporter family protein [Ruminococcaceae bacterium]|nr:alanine:cation symporter family protein [Oscillospiraceae bacterium]